MIDSEIINFIKLCKIYASYVELEKTRKTKLKVSY